MLINRDPYHFKEEVSSFQQELCNLDLSVGAKDNFTSSFKHVLFMEFLYCSHPDLSHKKFVKSIIYDVLSSILAIIQKRERYLYLNVRSMIEHIARIALQKIDNGGDFDITVRSKDFELLKTNKPSENWIYLHQQYKQSCGWIHSSSNVGLNILSTFNELLTGDIKNSSLKQSIYLNKLTSEIVRVFYSYYENEIKNIFMRKMDAMKYLVGKSNFTYFSINFP
ncbi:hypothetical protein QU768_06340 [Proteus mirabilis]|uniref:hypothetical protein n=1 Tax=Proteus mirabilis TaxID=584 RepID=UPI001F5F5405|nr:hypothetical protein [Proteus mirabilis]MDK6200912.1 hypothetical protein [Proteus mirabilis]MDM9218183.1 hypothetical protein [Proteus mirabilis]